MFIILLSIESIKLVLYKYQYIKASSGKSVPDIYSFPLYCPPTGGLGRAGSSKLLRYYILAFPSELSIGINISNLGDNDDDSGKAEFITTRPLPLLLPNLPEKVLLLVTEEKSDRSVLELAAINSIPLTGATGEGELDCRYCKIIFCGLVIRMFSKDNNDDETGSL